MARPTSKSPERPELRVWRVILGFALAPIIPGFVIVPLMLVYVGERQGLMEVLRVIRGWSFMASFFTLPATLLVGVPLFLLYRWRGWTSWQSFALGGAAVGSLVVLFAPSLFFLGAGVISGTITTLTLWVCAYGDRKAITVSGSIFALIFAMALLVMILGLPETR